MSDFLLKPIYYLEDNSVDSWVLFESGKFRHPIAIIPAYEMAALFQQFNEKKVEVEAALKARKKAKK